MTDQTGEMAIRPVNLEILMERSVRRRCYRLFLRSVSQTPRGDRVDYVKSAIIEHVPVGSAIPETPFTMDDESAQALMDELWRFGFRPSVEIADMNTVVAAMDNHISDLRDIVFSQLKVESAKKKRVIR